MLCLAPRSCSYSDMCWPWRRREEPLSRQRSEKRHYLLPQGNTGARGNSAISRCERESEREQVPEKAVLCPQQSKKRVIFSGLDNRASVGPCPYYYTSKACLHWVWYCLDFSTEIHIVDHAEWCKEVQAFPLSPSSLPHFIRFSPFQVSFSKIIKKVLYLDVGVDFRLQWSDKVYIKLTGGSVFRYCALHG